MRLKPAMIAAVVLAAGLAWFFRYDVSPAGPGMSHIVDRWTGRAYFLRGRTLEEVRYPSPSPSAFDPTTARPTDR